MVNAQYGNGVSNTQNQRGPAPMPMPSAANPQPIPPTQYASPQGQQPQGQQQQGQHPQSQVRQSQVRQDQASQVRPNASRSVMQPAVPQIPKASVFKKKKKEKTSQSSLQVLQDVMKEGDDNPARLITILSVAFLVVFLLLAANSIRNEKNTATKLATNILQAEMSADTLLMSDHITNQVKWMDMAIALRGTSSQTVNVAARGPNVTGVAMLDASGAVLAHYPQAAQSLNAVSLSNFPASGVNLTSLMSQGGVANPVIVRKSADTFLVTMLAPGSLIGDKNMLGMSALLTPGGNLVIDGASIVATNGVLDSLSLTQLQLTKLTTQTNESSITSANVKGSEGLIAASKVANTDLTFIKTIPKNSVKLPSNLLLFAVLFLSAAGLIVGLIRIARSQIEAIKKSDEDTNVSRDRYRVAVEGGRGGVWEIDLKNNSVYVNSSLSKLLGLSSEEETLNVSQFLAIFQASDRERFLNVIRRAHLEGDIDIELRVAHLPIVLQCRGNCSVRGYQDGSTVIVGVAMDITEQRGAQSRLQSAETRLFDALNSMSDSFVIWDALGRIVLWNGKFSDFFGFKQGQLQPGLEQTVVEQIANQSIAEFFEPEGTQDHIEIKLKDGRWIRYTEATTADGGKVSIGTNITELRHREDDLRENDNALRKTVDVLKKSQSRIMELADNYEQEKIRAEDANQSKSDFLANMSHELRTPLNAINGFSDIMKKEMFGPLGDPRYKEYVGDILFSGQHLLSLINDILDMSKIEAGKMTLNIDFIQVNEMISQVVRIVRGRAEEKRLKLIYEGIDFEEIEADQRAVKQVLLNLITNAIKFTPEGGTVTVEAERKSAGVIIRIVDSGIGITKENIERLAKPFEQIDTEHSKQQEGTGLGLALSKSLIELHGGNFLMESEPGVGTTVTFTLPNVPAETAQNKDPKEVGNEINRLAQDIANVLDESESISSGLPAPYSPAKPAPNNPSPYPDAPNKNTAA